MVSFGDGEEEKCEVKIRSMAQSFSAALSFPLILLVITVWAKTSHIISNSDLKDIGYDDGLEMMV